MSKIVSKKVLAFEVKELKPEAKEKINALMKKKAEDLEKIVRDYKAGLLTPQ
jgi:hypothetical protein